MHWTEKWAWKIYLVIFSLFTLANLISILYENSYLYIYYNILITFHKSYLFSYWYAVLCNVISLISLISLYLFVFRIKFLKAVFWQWVFVFKIVFDLLGHSFEIKALKSLFYNDARLGFVSVVLMIAILLPSYVAAFQYAFLPQKIFKE